MEGAATTLTTGAGPAAASLPDARHTDPDLGAAGAEGDEENMDYRYFRLPTGAERFPAPGEINTPTNPAPIFSAAYAPCARGVPSYPTADDSAGCTTPGLSLWFNFFAAGTTTSLRPRGQNARSRVRQAEQRCVGAPFFFFA